MSIECSFDHSFDRQQLEMTGKSFFYNFFLRGACPHRMRQEADFRYGHQFLLIFSYYEPKLGGGGAPWSPSGGITTQNIKKNVLGHVIYQLKAHEKLYSNMSIKCSYDHSFDHQQLKITRKSFFYSCFIEGSMSTPNDRKLNFGMDISLTYIFIF